MNPDYVAEALKLEEKRFGKFHEDAAQARETAFNTLSVPNSGGRRKRQGEIALESVEALIDKAIALRRQLAAGTPELLLPVHLQTLRTRLEQLADSAITTLQMHQTNDATLLAMRTRQPVSGVGTGAAVMQAAHRRVLVCKNNIRREIENLESEGKINSRPKEASTHVTNNNIINVNANHGVINTGTIERIQMTLSNTQSADPALIQGFLDFTKAVESAQMNDSAKQEVLENLAFVAEQLKSQPAQRAPNSTVQTILGAIGKAVVGSAINSGWHALLPHIATFLHISSSLHL